MSRLLVVAGLEAALAVGDATPDLDA